mmetsp:Transcript_9713/g.14616  ORF Transcript_9713/g.14616 Transcript_9713/m.14616 type:complete len:86 (-) Transcript_9713:97-354(-)
MSYFKVLALTHLSCFLGGVIVGKSVDAEELAAYRYRSSNSGDSIMDWAKKILWIGSSLVGVAVVVFGIGRLTAGRAAGAAPKRIE